MSLQFSTRDPFFLAGDVVDQSPRETLISVHCDPPVHEESVSLRRPKHLPSRYHGKCIRGSRRPPADRSAPCASASVPPRSCLNDGSPPHCDRAERRRRWQHLDRADAGRAARADPPRRRRSTTCTRTWPRTTARRTPLSCPLLIFLWQLEWVPEMRGVRGVTSR